MVTSESRLLAMDDACTVIMHYCIAMCEVSALFWQERIKHHTITLSILLFSTPLTDHKLQIADEIFVLNFNGRSTGGQNMRHKTNCGHNQKLREPQRLC
jgi:hypothetical protein